MKKTCLVFLTILLIFSFSKTSVLAHQLQKDGSIGAVLHIDPSDNPIAGKPAYFYFDFKDSSGRLNLSECSCQVTIFENEHSLSSPILTISSSDQSATFSFTFPEKALYKIRLTGTPFSPSEFQNFKLDYSVRVDKDSGFSFILPGHLEHYLAIVIVLLGFLFFFVFGILKQKVLKGGI